jgi:hypothetical protein
LIRNQARACVLLLVLVGLAGCTGASSPPPPTAPSPVSFALTPPPPPVSGLTYAVGAVLVNASLSGVVFEMTPTGPVPLSGVSVYCDACGEVGHTEKITDNNGFYSFSGDVDRGGGVWLNQTNTLYLIVRKAGYSDPPGLPPRPVSQGWRDVPVKGDTRFDIQLVGG